MFSSSLSPSDLSPEDSKVDLEGEWWTRDPPPPDIQKQLYVHVTYGQDRPVHWVDNLSPSDFRFS